MLREVLDADSHWVLGESMGVERNAETVIGFWESRWVLREVLDADTDIGFWENRWVLKEVLDAETVRLGVEMCWVLGESLGVERISGF